MPSLQKIDAFKKSLRALGREPEIAAERGETIADIKPPESVLSDDLTSLLDLPSINDEDGGSPGASVSGPDRAPDVDSPSVEVDALPEDGGDFLSGNGEDAAALLSGLFDGTDDSMEKGTGPGEDLFSFPEDVPFESAGGDESPEPEPDMPDSGFPALDPSLDTEDNTEAPAIETEADTDDSPPGTAGAFPDEPPSPDELFSLDFTSSFGEDHTGDLFSSEEPATEDVLEPAPADDAPDTTLEAENVDFGEFDFSEEPASLGGSDDHESGELFSLPEADTLVIPSGIGSEGADDVPEEPGDVPEADEFSIDGFNLGDIGHDYGVPDSAPDDDEVPVPDDGPAPSFDVFPGASSPADEEQEIRILLSDEDFRSLQKTLSSLPRNLKIVVEELIGEDKVRGEALRSLVSLLVHGESVYTIASFSGKLIGKKIPVPKGYEKKSVLELEAEQASFSYVFRHAILPVLLRLTGLAAVLCLTVFLGYRLVYRPVSAQILYSRGYEHLTENRFQPAIEDFDEAVSLQPMRGWFFRYAEGFIAKKQYPAAEEKFDQLLERYPDDEKAVLAYAALETGKLANYEKAERLLDFLLNRDMYHYEALLAQGDNYMVWAEEDPAKLEEARRSYATLIQKYGSIDEVLFRMLAYFIRADKYDEVKKLQTYFQSNPKKNIDPSAYAELAGYLITKNDLDDVENILFRARDRDEMIPEIHYQLARLFRKTKEPEEERKALVNARSLFENAGTETRRELGMLIDTHVRLGEALFSEREYISSEQSFRKAIGLYEDALSRRLLQPMAEFGRMYAGLGDIMYYVSGELSAAGELFLKAREHGYDTPELSYRIGFVGYSLGKYDAALKEFHRAASGYFDNGNLLYSTANALFQREDYFAAQGYYESLLSILERKRDAWPLERIFEDPDQRSLVSFLMKVYNNLGVTLLRLGMRTGNVEKTSKSMVYFTESSEYYDLLSRNRDTLERSATKNLAYLNTRSVIYPQPNYEAQIYQEIPKDHAAKSF